MRPFRLVAGIFGRAFIGMQHDPSRAVKKLAVAVVSFAAVSMLAMEAVLAVTVADAYAFDKRAQVSQTRYEMINVASNDYVMARSQFLEAHSLKDFRTNAARLRTPYTYWRLSDEWYNNKPPKEFQITRQLRGAYIYFTVRDTNGLVEEYDQPLLGYTNGGHVQKDLPLVLVCRDGIYAKCNGTPPRVIATLHL